MINIKDFDKAEVLKTSYDNSRYQGLSFLATLDPDDEFTVADAKDMLKRSSYVDYYYGRVIKVDFSGDEINERLYDRDCGEGAVFKAISSIRK